MPRSQRKVIEARSAGALSTELTGVLVEHLRLHGAVVYMGDASNTFRTMKDGRAVEVTVCVDTVHGR